MTTDHRLSQLARAYVDAIDSKRYSTAQYVLTAIVEVVRQEREQMKEAK